MEVRRCALPEEVDETGRRTLAVEDSGVEELSEGEGLKKPTPPPPGSFSLDQAFPARSRFPAPDGALVFQQVPTEFQGPEHGVDGD